jgi:hypothetical protein
MRLIFFHINRSGTGPLHNYFSLFDYGFEFAGTVVIENRLPVITDTESLNFQNFFY